MTTEDPIFVLGYENSENHWRQMLCSTGDDHTIASGGESYVVLGTEYLAKWKFLTFTNAMVPESLEYPLATALVCDRCVDLHPEDLELKYVFAGNPAPGDGRHYWRIPVEELEKPEIYWPDLHPDAEHRQN